MHCLYVMFCNLCFIGFEKVLNYFLLLWFCFKNLDLLYQQTTQFDFSLSTLFVIFNSCGLKLCVKSLHPMQYVVPSSFLVLIGFTFNWAFLILCNLVKHFLTTYFKHFDFLIEVLIFLFRLLVLSFFRL